MVENLCAQYNSSWNNFISEINPVYNIDVNDFIQNSDTIIIHGTQNEVLNELYHRNVTKNIFDLTGSFKNEYIGFYN